MIPGNKTNTEIRTRTIPAVELTRRESTGRHSANGEEGEYSDENGVVMHRIDELLLSLNEKQIRRC